MVNRRQRQHAPRIAFVTTCKGRVQHLKQTLPQNLKDNAGYRNAVFVIISYGDPETVRYVEECHPAELQSGRVLLFHVQGVDKFKMAHAKNVAHRCGIEAGADILVNMDADNYTGMHFAQYIADQFTNFDRVFLWGCMIKGKLDRGISGRIACRTEDFMKCGGYDETFAEWGPDDKDFNMRLRLLGLIGIEIPHEFLSAVRHNDRMRFKEYPDANGTDYEIDCVKDAVNPTCAIANYGNYGCCTGIHNFDTFELRPTATRIFGIGLHKTGTASLNRAFQILGYDSVHWPSARWAKSVVREMNEYGHSRLLDCSFASCDLPIPLYFKQLDKAYPGSKFVLTIRPTANWLRSVERHFLHEFNPYRKQWNNDWATHQIHKMLYGRKAFDREIFAKRYHDHNLEVMEHFKGRPNDLLILPTGHSGWDMLCPFLDQPVPSVPYPHLNVTPLYAVQLPQAPQS
jgi:hypothetical protein